MSTILSIKKIENQHDVYRGRDCMKKFCQSLSEHAMKMINFKKKKMNLLTKQQQESYENAKICYISKKKLKTKIWNIKIIVKLEIIVIMQGNIEGSA